MKSVSNGVQASSISQELLLPSPQAFILLVFLQLLLKGHLRSWFQMCKPLDCIFLLLIFFLISIIAGDDEVCRNNLRCFTLVEVFQIIVIVIASYFIADFISVVPVSKCCSILLELLCSWMHSTTAFWDFGFLSWQRLTSCAFKPVFHHIWHHFGFQRTKCYVLQLFLSSSLSPRTFLYCSSLFLSVCLSVCLLTKQLLAWWSFLLPETSQTYNQRMQETDPPWLLMIVSQILEKFSLDHTKGSSVSERN